MRQLLLIPLLLIPLGFTWDINNEEEPERPVWETSQTIKWDTPEDPYKDVEIDQPDAGWYADPKKYPIPVEWSDIVRRRYQELTRDEKMTDDQALRARTWDRPPLRLNTKWIDSKSDKEQGYIFASIPEFNRFTVFKLDPPNGTIHQNMKGKAKIFNLDDNTQYRIVAFDARDVVAVGQTAVADKYVRIVVLYRGVGKGFHEEGGGRFYTDEYRNIYSAFKENANNSFVLGIDQFGNQLWNYQGYGDFGGPGVYNDIYLDKTNNHLVTVHYEPQFDDDPGDYKWGTVSASIIVTNYLSGVSVRSKYYNGISDIMQTITKASDDSGYVLGRLKGDEYVGQLRRLDSELAYIAWGSGTTPEMPHVWWKRIKIDLSGDYVASGHLRHFGEDHTVPGTSITATRQCAAPAYPPSNSIDNDDATTWYSLRCGTGDNNEEIKIDFGAGNSYPITSGIIDPPESGTTHPNYRVWGSPDDSAWTLIKDYEAGNFPAFTDDWGNRTAYRYIRIDQRLDQNTDNPGLSCDGMPASCAPFGHWAHWIYELELFSFVTDYERAIVAKYEGDSGGSEGDTIFEVHNTGVSRFQSIATSTKDSDYRVVGHDDNGIYVARIDALSGATVWEKSFPAGTTGWSIEPALENGGHIISGDYRNPTTGRQQMYLLKISDSGDEEWSQYFNPGTLFQSGARHAIETDDRGYLASGYAQADGDNRKIYLIKTNRHGESCSAGVPCE